MPNRVGKIFYKRARDLPLSHIYHYAIYGSLEVFERKVL